MNYTVIDSCRVYRIPTSTACGGVKARRCGIVLLSPVLARGARSAAVLSQRNRGSKVFFGGLQNHLGKRFRSATNSSQPGNDSGRLQTAASREKIPDGYRRQPAEDLNPKPQNQQPGKDSGRLQVVVRWAPRSCQRLCS